MTPDEFEKLRVALAEKAHENETEFGKAANLAAVNNGTEALKAILLLNGGACVAMLALIGTLATTGRLNPEMINPLVCFAAGAACSVIAGAFGYFTNLLIAGSSNTKTRHYDQPFIRETKTSNKHYFWGEITRWTAIIIAAVGIGLFVYGVFNAYFAFKSIPLRPAAIACSTTSPACVKSMEEKGPNVR
jgi:hypothetical protein